MVVFRYSSPIGIMLIYPNSNGRFNLLINDVVYGNYATAQQAADDVYCQATGCDKWDMLNFFGAPADLSEWERLTY